MVLSMQAAIWSPAAGPFMRMQSPWVLQKSLAKLSGLKVLLGPAAKAFSVQVRKFNFLQR